MRLLSSLGAGALLAYASSATTIEEINGDRFQSPLDGEDVTGVEGLVTAIGPNGFWIRSMGGNNLAAFGIGSQDERGNASAPQASESLYVYGSDGLDDVNEGDLITLSGRVIEYRSQRNHLYLTELTNATDITVLSENYRFMPKVLGQGGLSPPTETYTDLDDGDIFGVPNNVTRISTENPVLRPNEFGLDFWEALSGELVTIESPIAISKPNQFGDVWVKGTWATTGDNSRGGLTNRDGDANPEAIQIITPLDGSRNPSDGKVGDVLGDITGIVQYAFGDYGIYPLTNITVLSSPEPELPPSSNLTSTGSCDGITMAQYNVENLNPESDQFDAIAEQIVVYLRSPDLIFLQEVQDNNGPTNDGTVVANLTLSLLADALVAAGSEVEYAYTEIPPIDNQEGGQPGGNIRNAYLYNSAVLRLAESAEGTAGDSTDPVEVLSGPQLNYNPGRISPDNEAFVNSRVPLAAHFEVIDGGASFFAVNVHHSSKGGSSTLDGDPRPPINNGVDRRTEQNEVTGAFIAAILAEDPNAKVVAAGDYNEFAFVAPMLRFEEVSGLRNIDEVVEIPEVERYTYVFEQNSQQLDHMYISQALVDAAGGVEFEHVHVSSWVSFGDQVSDHDPSVGRFDVC